MIDLECDLPPDENGKPHKMERAMHPPGYGDPERLPPLPGHGFSNYERIVTLCALNRGRNNGSGNGLQPKPRASAPAYENTR